MSNLNLLNVFIEVANSGNITKAAERLYISQPAITKSIKQLENEIGGKLFERKNKGVVLTPEGEVIYNKVKPLINGINNVYDYFPNVQKLRSGVLRIGTVTSNITILLSKALNEFIRRYPKIEIKITRGKENSLINMLKNNELDLLILDTKSIKKDLEEIRLYNVKYSIVGNEDYYKKHKSKPMTKEIFASSPLALINSGNTSRKNIDAYFNKFNIELNAKYEMENYGLIIDLIKSGAAIGVVNLDYFSKEVENREIFKIHTDFEIEQRTISVVKSAGNYENPARNVFIEILKKN